MTAITLMDVAYTSNEKPVNITPQLPKIQKMVYNIMLNNPGLNGLVSTKSLKLLMEMKKVLFMNCQENSLSIS